jgi:glycosyltransferase involved in cell wall biosynthesis
MSDWTPRSVSVVVPVFNEVENVRQLVHEIVQTLRPMGMPSEVVIVDDASTDGTLSELRALLPTTPELVVIELRRNFGQTLALLAGLDRSSGDAVVTMDGDLQNDPADVPMMLRELSKGADVVSGWRKHRQDGFLLRRIPSWAANWLIRSISGIPIHDQGCALKAYRSELVDLLDLYGDMHRFIGMLTIPLGARLVEVEVSHRPRVAGSSAYGTSRIWKVLADLLTMQMLTRFRERPSRWFALLGLPFLAMGLIALSLPFAVGASVVVPATVAFISLTTFSFCVLVGILGEAALESSGGSSNVICRERSSI